MTTHGTLFTPGQQATITSRLAVAVPGALEILADRGLDIKTVLRCTTGGDNRLELALVEAIRMLYDGNAATVPTEVGPKKVQMSRREKRLMRGLLLETLKSWYLEADAKKAKLTARFKTPSQLDYVALSQDIDPGKFGEYVLNPDTQGIDFENAKPIVIDLPQFVGRPRYEVMKYIVDTYGATHHIAGIEYWQWVTEHPDEAPQSLKDGNWHYFVGSLLRGEVGHWNVPYAYWNGSKFVRSARWLGNDWDARERVVLLEKCSLALKHCR